MSRLAVFMVDGFEEIEALTVVDLARRAGIEVDVISAMADCIVCGSHKIPVVCDMHISDVEKDVYDMVVLPGGPGHRALEENSVVMDMVDTYFAKGKFVAAICAAPSILGKRGILNGKKACCFPSFEKYLEGAEVSFDKVCVDGNVITSRGMGTAMDFAIAIVEALEGKEKALEKAKEIVYV